MRMQINTSILDSSINAKAKCAVNLTQFPSVISACDFDDVQPLPFVDCCVLPTVRIRDAVFARQLTYLLTIV